MVMLYPYFDYLYDQIEAAVIEGRFRTRL